MVNASRCARRRQHRYVIAPRVHLGTVRKDTRQLDSAASWRRKRNSGRAVCIRMSIMRRCWFFRLFGILFVSRFWGRSHTWSGRRRAATLENTLITLIYTHACVMQANARAHTRDICRRMCVCSVAGERSRITAKLTKSSRVVWLCRRRIRKRRRRT